MNEWITEKLKSLKEDLSKKQELFKVNIMNINSPTYEDNTVNDLLVMKKLKTEIEQLELILQLYGIFSQDAVLSKKDSDIFNEYIEKGDIETAFGNSDWNHIYRKIVGDNSSDFAEKCMEDAYEI